MARCGFKNMFLKDVKLWVHNLVGLRVICKVFQKKDETVGLILL